MEKMSEQTTGAAGDDSGDPDDGAERVLPGRAAVRAGSGGIEVEEDVDGDLETATATSSVLIPSSTPSASTVSSAPTASSARTASSAPSTSAPSTSSTDDVSARPSKSRSRATFKRPGSTIWDHFEKTDDPKYAQCYYCDKKVGSNWTKSEFAYSG